MFLFIYLFENLHFHKDYLRESRDVYIHQCMYINILVYGGVSICLLMLTIDDQLKNSSASDPKTKVENFEKTI